MKRALLILTICFSLFSVSSLFAANEDNLPEKGIGIMAGYQNGQVDFMLPLWLSPNLQFIPGLGMIRVSDIFSEYRLSLGGKYFVSKSTVSPFVELAVGTFITSPANGDSYSDLLLGAGFGGEYFINRNISVGIELQLNYTKSDKQSLRFSNPGGTNLNTATMAYAVIYF